MARILGHFWYAPDLFGLGLSRLRLSGALGSHKVQSYLLDFPSSYLIEFGFLGIILAVEFFAADERFAPVLFYLELRQISCRRGVGVDFLKVPKKSFNLFG